MVNEGERDGPSENAGSNESRGGFKQLLVRGMTGFMSFAIGLSAVSPLLSVTSILSYGLATGGPVMMVWTWLITFFMSIIVACNFAEMCSVFPFTGSVYHW